MLLDNLCDGGDSTAYFENMHKESEWQRIKKFVDYSVKSWGKK
jgi:hypothetical protein